jgi:hypothetical protein
MDNDINEERITELLKEFKVQRDAVISMITEVEQLKSNVEGIFPEKLDARFKVYFDDKLKAATEFFKVLLDMRKEITKSLKDEIDIRRKISSKDKGINVEDLLDIRKLSDKVEDFKKEKERLKKKRREKTPYMPNDVEVPGVNTAIK